MNGGIVSFSLLFNIEVNGALPIHVIVHNLIANKKSE